MFLLGFLAFYDPSLTAYKVLRKVKYSREESDGWENGFMLFWRGAFFAYTRALVYAGKICKEPKNQCWLFFFFFLETPAPLHAH